MFSMSAKGYFGSSRHAGLGSRRTKYGSGLSPRATLSKLGGPGNTTRVRVPAIETRPVYVRQSAWLGDPQQAERAKPTVTSGVSGSNSRSSRPLSSVDTVQAGA